jgi:hypothetical protein
MGGPPRETETTTGNAPAINRRRCSRFALPPLLYLGPSPGLGGGSNGFFAGCGASLVSADFNGRSRGENEVLRMRAT